MWKSLIYFFELSPVASGIHGNSNIKNFTNNQLIFLMKRISVISFVAVFLSFIITSKFNRLKKKIV